MPKWVYALLSLHGIVNLDIAGFNPELLRDFATESLNAESFRCVVSAGKVRNAGLSGDMRCSLGDFPGKVGIGAALGCFFQIILSGSRAPSNTPNRTRCRSDDKRLTSEHAGNGFGKSLNGKFFFRQSRPAEIVLSEAPRGRKP